MRALALAAALIVLAGSASAQGIYHQGYTTRNGTYVAPHYQSAPNNSVYDNYSTRGNTNPYTGQAGTVNPYPSYSAPSYSSPYSAPYYGYGNSYQRR